MKKSRLLAGNYLILETQLGKHWGKPDICGMIKHVGIMRPRTTENVIRPVRPNICDERPRVEPREQKAKSKTTQNIYMLKIRVFFQQTLGNDVL
jgi:hypothetical protein